MLIILCHPVICHNQMEKAAGKIPLGGVSNRFGRISITLTDTKGLVPFLGAYSSKLYNQVLEFEVGLVTSTTDRK